MTRPAAISVRGLEKRFGDKTVLQGIDLDIQDGDVTCIIGPSGSGKSTLLRSLAFLDAYDAGEVHIFGKMLGWRETPLGREKAGYKELTDTRRPIGMVFQHFHLVAAFERAGQCDARIAVGPWLLPQEGRRYRARNAQ